MAFIVFQDDQIVLRYYLETTNYFELYYMLCSMSPDMLSHKQIKSFGNKKPTYAELKQHIIQDLTYGVNQPPFLIKSISFNNEV